MYDSHRCVKDKRHWTHTAHAARLNPRQRAGRGASVGFHKPDTLDTARHAAAAMHYPHAPAPRESSRRARRPRAIYLSLISLRPRIWPVRRAAMRPTFWPGTESRLTVDGWPMCWWLPPPCGCSTGFIATPRTFGHELRLTRYLWKARPALSRGLSMRPPPATMPIDARDADEMVFFCPDGSRTRVFPAPSMCWIICAKPPDVLANLPLSPACFSTLLITVPGGIDDSGSTLPGTSCARLPQYTNWPVYIPSVAVHCSFMVLNLYWFLNSTLAMGAPRPGSWMMSRITPRM
mmetsp:Transcript_48496/g.160714  ORF Transcript_48496/g.160714 Transcript_48496/m.160714 type:complete len:291 (+) Transcript_48496:11-883(+)